MIVRMLILLPVILLLAAVMTMTGRGGGNFGATSTCLYLSPSVSPCMRPPPAVSSFSWQRPSPV